MHLKIVKYWLFTNIRMAPYQALDELIREYLLFRGFASSLKAFDVENSFYNLERCFIASSIEFKWAPGNPKFVAIESKIWPDFKKHLWSTSIWNVSKGIGNFTGKYTTGKQPNPLLAPIAPWDISMRIGTFHFSGLVVFFIWAVFQLICLILGIYFWGFFKNLNLWNNLVAPW